LPQPEAIKAASVKRNKPRKDLNLTDVTTDLSFRHYPVYQRYLILVFGNACMTPVGLMGYGEAIC